MSSTPRSRSFQSRFFRELSAAGLPTGPASSPVIADTDIASLPGPAQRYLRFMKVIGQPRTWSVSATATGRFRMGPDKPWMACEARQYDTRLGVARIFHMKVRLAGFVPVYVRDTYVRGQGRMLARVLDVVPIVDVADERVRIGELVTYLNDAVLFAPSMLLGPETTWTAVDARSFDVALTDRGLTVSARVFVDDRGAPLDFSTTDRFVADPNAPKRMMRARWTTPVVEWTRSEGHPVPSQASAVWHLADDQEFVYAEFRFRGEDVEFDVAPRLRSPAAEVPR